MDQLLRAAEIDDDNDATVSTASLPSGGLSPTSSYDDTPEEIHPPVPEEPPNAISTFGEKLGVEELHANSESRNAQRENASDTASSASSKRSFDQMNDADIREDSSEGGSSGHSAVHLNDEFMSNLHDARDHERFKNQKLRHENLHHKYSELSGEEINVMKLDLLYKISVLNDAGFQSPKAFTIEDSLVALEAEHGRLSNLEDLQYGMQMMRYVMTNGVSLMESINENFRLSPLRLKGWSVAVHRDVQKYNPILLELYQQHAYAVRLSPLTKLCIALCFSAASTHLANSLRNNEEDRGDNNMFSSVMNIFSAGRQNKAPGQDRKPAAAPGSTTAGLPRSGASTAQPAMQAPPTL